MLIKNLLWEATSKIVVQGIAFLFSIFLTRQLTPEIYGEFGVIMAFVIIFHALMDFSLVESFVQKHDANQKELSSGYWGIVFMGGVTTLVFFVFIPIICKYLGYSNLGIPLRWMSLVFIISVIGDGIGMTVTRAMNFKVHSKISMIANFSSSCIGLISAYQGFGIYALIFQFISKTSISTVLYFMFEKWRPTLYFNLNDIKIVSDYASKRTATKFINQVITNLDTVVLSISLPVQQLGFYNKAKSVTNQYINNSSSIFSGVYFSYFSKHKEKNDLLIASFIKAFFLLFSITLLISILLVIFGENLFVFMFKEEWKESGQIFQYLIGISFVYPLIELIQVYLNAINQATTTLKINVLTKSLQLICLFIAFKFGLTYFLISLIIKGILELIVNVVAMWKYII
ncbi:hypothetical protein EI427_06510 [Flammeovirga pectinis]|uniref:Lipopolysaccharide biosynthesis protein n=1 Tax=Flammeovirga pectinis TaxID=2494373 RepID=A0A3S9P151_9BACT|nr:oligosaccharide flippase family protein [Flammeovirga pectinis]AZQ61902.1 hypothetical protein EI427_06510 [Flammeovirga pectinis]